MAEGRYDEPFRVFCPTYNISETEYFCHLLMETLMGEKTEKFDKVAALGLQAECPVLETSAEFPYVVENGQYAESCSLLI